MPLKHLTETLLLIALAVAVAFTAFAVSVLPPLPLGVLPWGVLLLLTLAYPFSLYGLFRTHRADRAFRFLHFAPAAIVLLWMAFQMLKTRAPRAGVVSDAFTWLHGAGPLLLVYALIAAFCLQVIRRRLPRLFTLCVLTAAFLGFAFLSTSRGWDARLQRQVATLFGPGSGSGSHVSSGSGMIAENPASSRAASSIYSSARRAASSAMRIASSVPLRSSSSSAPPTPAAPHLPSSGFGAEGLATAMMAGYCSVLHIRARRRMKP